MPRPASPLGEVSPVGAFWLCLRRGGESKYRRYRRCRCEGNGLSTRCVAVQGTTKSVASLAVAIIHAEKWLVSIGTVDIDYAVVVVGVVPNMEADRLFLVLAIRCRRSPDGLQWKQYQEEDGNPAAHKSKV